MYHIVIENECLMKLYFILLINVYVYVLNWSVEGTSYCGLFKTVWNTLHQQ